VIVTDMTDVEHTGVAVALAKDHTTSMVEAIITSAVNTAVAKDKKILVPYEEQEFFYCITACKAAFNSFRMVST